MNYDTARERDDLRKLLSFPQIGLPEYSVDLIVQRRVGNLITEGAKQNRVTDAGSPVSRAKPH